MKTKNILFLLGAIVVLAAFVFIDQINDGLGCLAYWEQCTAKQIEGLTNEQCLEREDTVAYLLDKKICLVKR